MFRHKYTKILIALLAAFFLIGSGKFSGIEAYAFNDATDFLADYQKQFKELFADVDDETITDAFDFLQEKAADGSLKSEAGIKKAVEEGKEKFNADFDHELSEQQIKSMIELATTLEDMGFNSEKIIAKAKSLYNEYGIDFVDHTEELIYEAVKDSVGTAIKNAISAFFRMLAEFFRELISSFK